MPIPLQQPRQPVIPQFDFTSGAIDPSESILNALKFGGALQQLEAQKQQTGFLEQQGLQKQRLQEQSIEQNILSLQQQRENIRQQVKFREALDDYRVTPTPDKLRDLMFLIPGGEVAALKAEVGRRDKEVNKQRLGQSLSILNPLLLNTPEGIDAAMSNADRIATVLENSGDPLSQQDAKNLRGVMDVARQDVPSAQAMLASGVFVLGGDAALEGATKFAKTRQESVLFPKRFRKLEAEIEEIEQRVEEKRARLEIDQLKLPPSAIKVINKDVEDSVKSSMLADEIDDLVKDIERFTTKDPMTGETIGTIPAGKMAEIQEKWKQFAGKEGPVSLLKNRYNQIRSTMAIASLPPGPATDRDIEIAFRGFPSPDAGPVQLAAFLRGRSKINRMVAEIKDVSAEWVKTYKNRGSASSPSNILGMDVEKGETLRGFGKRFTDNLFLGNSAQIAPIAPIDLEIDSTNDLEIQRILDKYR